MNLPRRRPRQVYRVYAEDDFPDSAADEPFVEDDISDNGSDEPLASDGLTAPFGTAERRRRRLTGAAMLAGAVGAVGGLAITHGTWPPLRAADRHLGVRSSADSHAPRRSPSADGRPGSATTLFAARAHSTVVARTPRSGRGRRGSDVVARASHAAGRAGQASVGRPASPVSDRRLGSSGPAGRAWPGRAEFGFER